jgi:hypothetical protein
MRRQSARSPHHGCPQGGLVTLWRAAHQRGNGAAKWGASLLFFRSHAVPPARAALLRWQAQCLRVRSCSCLTRAWISRCCRCRSRKKRLRRSSACTLHARAAPARPAVARSAAAVRAASRRSSRARGAAAACGYQSRKLGRGCADLAASAASSARASAADSAS